MFQKILIVLIVLFASNGAFAIDKISPVTIQKPPPPASIRPAKRIEEEAPIASLEKRVAQLECDRQWSQYIVFKMNMEIWRLRQDLSSSERQRDAIDKMLEQMQKNWVMPPKCEGSEPTRINTNTSP